MSATILARGVRDRWLGTTLTSAFIGLFLVGGMAIYGQIDLTLYASLPEAIRSVMGIPDGADAASLAYNVIYGFIAAMTLAGLAVSMGASTIAAEERDRTIGLLLATPTSRARVLASKATAMVAVIAVGALVLTAAAYAAPDVLGVELGATHVGALQLHLFVNALFYGALAMAIGGWTGNRTLASAVSGGVMVLSYFAVGLLPLVERTAGLVRFFPWHYFDGSAPLLNGVDLGDLAVLGAGIVGLTAVAFVGLARRDLRQGNGGRSLLERLRENPRTRRVVERLAGSTRVSSIWLKTASEHQAILVVTSLTMFWMMGVMIGPMFAAVESQFAGFADALPEVVLRMVGAPDLSTAAGFYQVETYSLMAPIAVMLVTIVVGARALAGEERDRTMGLLLATPITRARVVLEKAVAMVVHAVVVGVATFAGVVAGATLGRLDMSIPNIAATTLLVTLLGLVFGSLALALGAATGRVRVAVYGAAGVGALAYLADAFLPVVESLAGWARWSPFHYYLSSDPLANGMAWGHGAVLALLSLAFVAAAVWLFDRRDLRQG